MLAYQLTTIYFCIMTNEKINEYTKNCLNAGLPLSKLYLWLTSEGVSMASISKSVIDNYQRIKKERDNAAALYEATDPDWKKLEDIVQMPVKIKTKFRGRGKRFFEEKTSPFFMRLPARLHKKALEAIHAIIDSESKTWLKELKK